LTRLRLLFVIILLIAVPAMLLAQTSNNPPTSATGSQKVVEEKAQGSEGHGEEHEGKKYFGVPGWILKIINMLLFIGLLAWLAGGPVKGALVTRSAEIRKAADEARERRAKADQLAGDIQARLSRIEADVRAIHERAEQEGERQKRELIAAAEAEAQKILSAARNEVDNRLKHARHELTEYAGQLASDRAESILRESINDADRRKLFVESLHEVGEARS
jgi:F-type H+-transporting ATPase subunit b